MIELEDKYIELLLKRCLNFERSKSLMIHLDFKEHLPFANKVKEYAQKMGIYDVCIHINDMDDIHDYLKNTKLDDIKLNPTIDRSDWEEYSIKGGSLLFLTSTVPGLMNDIEDEKVQKWIMERNKTTPYYRKNVTSYAFPWTIAALPNERWAKQIFPNDNNSYDKLYKYILEMCMVDRDDPVKAWENYIKENNRYKNRLNELKITRLHYTNSLGTDLYIEKPENNIWINLDKTDIYGNPIISNMPSYEIFTTPNKKKTEGIIYSSRPLFYNDVCIDNFYLVFKNGKVVDFKAEVGQKTLETLIYKNENACYLGEIALVPYNSPISNTNIVFNETLFDENASCHFALGSAYSKCVPNFKNISKEELYKIGFNESQVHVDFMIGTSDLMIEADTIEGKKLIFKNGNFII